MRIWFDMFFLEVVEPEIGELLAPGAEGYLCQTPL
jgi:phenylacetate-coenzyme A ligase PaaK-like adenylate-forming protein